MGNGLATHEMSACVQDDPQPRQGVLKVEGLSILGGGLPIMHGSELIGAVGVSRSCGMPEDQRITGEAAAAIVAALPPPDASGAAD